ncbi:MAG: hypothetical protein Q8908_11305 [Bacteroidota bacterium]|nr:hypothetical protein [Bacteroidota bacterium]
MKDPFKPEISNLYNCQIPFQSKILRQPDGSLAPGAYQWDIRVLLNPDWLPGTES